MLSWRTSSSIFACGSQTYCVIKVVISVIGVKDVAFLRSEKYLSFKPPNLRLINSWYCLFESKNKYLFGYCSWKKWFNVLYSIGTLSNTKLFSGITSSSEKKWWSSLPSSYESKTTPNVNGTLLTSSKYSRAMYDVNLPFLKYLKPPSIVSPSSPLK